MEEFQRVISLIKIAEDIANHTRDIWKLTLPAAA